MPSRPRRTRGVARPREAAHARRPARGTRTATVRHACLLILILVVAIRPLIWETYETARDPLTAGLTEISAPSPLVTLGIDLTILALAVATMLSSIRGRANPGYRRTGLEWGVLFIVVGGGVSCLYAGNQRLAVSATLDWVCLPILAITLVQLTPRAWQRRVVIGAVLASACVQSYECFDQVATGREVQADYEQRKADGFWQRQGVELDSPRVKMFERRIYSNEAAGYLAHANVTGAYLVMCGLIAVGIAIARLQEAAGGRSRAWFALAGAGAIAMFVAVMFTRSRGAVVSGVIGLAAWGTWHVLRRGIRRHPRRALAIGWGIVGLSTVGVVGHGLYHGSLPGASLSFRWRYWTAAEAMFVDHPWTGVGRENFGREYLKYKSIQSPEEVATPHNVLVQAATEWGGAGLIGMVLLLVGASSAMATRPSHERASLDTERPGPPSAATARAPGGTLAVWGLGAGIALFALRLPLLGTDNAAFLVVKTAVPATLWLVSFYVFTADPTTLTRISDAVSAPLSLAIRAALLAFMFQETINFGLYVPGAAISVFALAAVAISERCPHARDDAIESADGDGASARAGGDAPRGRADQQRAEPGRWGVAAPSRHARRRTIPLIAVLVIFLAAVWIAIPAVRAWGVLQSARTAAYQPDPDIPPERQEAAMGFERAARLDPLDPTPLAERAEWLTGVAVGGGVPRSHRARWLEEAADSMRAAIRRDPRSVSLYRRLTGILLLLARTTHRSADHGAALDAARHVVELYPTDPLGHVALADRALAAAAAERVIPLARLALEHYEEALRMDAARPSWEVIRRLTPSRRARIQTGINDARRLLEALQRATP